MFDETRGGHEFEPGVAEARSASLAAVDRRMLLETIVTDLQWSALNVGTVLCLMNAMSRQAATWTLHPWRHLLQDHAQVVRLGLRFHNEIGIASSTATRIEKFYDELSDAKRASETFFMTLGAHAATQRDMVAARLPEWRTLAQEAIPLLAFVENDARDHVSSVYAENGRILAQFLREVGEGDTRRVNAWGEISLPALAQRRRTPRRSVSVPCRVVVAGKEIEALVRDVARGGVCIASSHVFSDHQRISIKLRGRAPLEGEVMWCRDGLAGTRFTVPLNSNDPLITTVT